MSERDRQMQDGTPCTLLQLVKAEPEWAANRIRVGETATKEKRELVETLRSLLWLIGHGIESDPTNVVIEKADKVLAAYDEQEDQGDE